MFEPPKLRLALGLGDQELEQRLRPALDGFEDIIVVAQCLAADQLLAAVDARQVDAVVVAWNLHRLTDAVLAQLERPDVPVVLLVADPLDERWRDRRDPTLSLDADVAVIRHAVLASRRGERVPQRPRAAVEPLPLKAADRPATLPDDQASSVLAVTGGYGSPGRTSVAINLAAALGTVAPTVLVELDLCTSAVVAYLDRDPSRNICTLAHAVREDSRAWSVALRSELQPLTQQGSSASVLCGPPKREMRASITPPLVERLLNELAVEYRWIVLDVGAELVGIDPAAANHRAALTRAQQVLLVVGADLVGLWHGRNALDQLERQVGIERERVGIVLNRFDGRHHHARSDVEWHLGANVAAVIPLDQNAAQQAIGIQQPMVAATSGRASRALLKLTEQLHEGQLRLPHPAGSLLEPVPWWRRLLPGRRARTTVRRLPDTERLPVTAARGRQGAAWS